jgi:hypothetical protein
MKIFLILIFLFPLFLEANSKNRIFSFGLYNIDVKVEDFNLSKISSKIKIYNKSQKKLHQEFQLDEIISFAKVYNHQKKKIFFFETFYPTEISGGSFINYIIEDRGKMELVKINIPWKNILIKDYSKNGLQDLIFFDHQYYQLNIDNCLNNSETDDWKWKGKLIPTIYRFDNNSYKKIEIEESPNILEEYAKDLQKSIPKNTYKNDTYKLRDFIHYFYVSSLIRKKNVALKFIRLFDESITYKCHEYSSDREQIIKKYEIQTTIYDFILQHKKEFKY